jgi:integrase
VIDRMAEVQQGELVFPGQRPDRPLAGTSLRRALKTIGRDDVAIHGLRATFRTWAAENTNFASEIAEAALGHRVGDGVERAYRRGSFFEKRRQLMDSWAAYCSRPAAEVSGAVIPIGVAR